MARVTHTSAVHQNQVQRARVTLGTSNMAIQAFAQKERQEQKTSADTTETIQRILGGQQYPAIKQQQSLALVQIMLHASVSAHSIPTLEAS